MEGYIKKDGACDPKKGRVGFGEVGLYQSASGITIDPSKYLEHRKKWEATHKTKLVRDIIKNSLGLDQKKIDDFIESVKNMEMKEFKKASEKFLKNEWRGTRNQPKKEPKPLPKEYNIKPDLMIRGRFTFPRQKMN